MYVLVSAFVVIGVIIFVHELGHFFMAKLFGVGVERFSVGYPPTMISHRWGETEYCIGWIPFGGYVKLVGEHPDTANDEGSRSFFNKPPAVKIAVLAAGPAMNIILGIVLLWMVLFFAGEGVPKYDVPQIGSVIPGMPASEMGLAPGDIIISIAGDTVTDWKQMAELIHSRPNVSTEILIQRDDSVFSIVCKPQPRLVRTENGDTTWGMLGIVPTTEQRPVAAVQAVGRSLYAAVGIVVAVISFLWNLVLGHASLADIGGPVMIAQMAGQSAKMGVWQLLAFIAALSINLAVLNLFPLPILDGGQIVFSLVEAIRKKTISAKVIAAFQQASIVFLLAIMLLVTIKDILRLF